MTLSVVRASRPQPEFLLHCCAAFVVDICHFPSAPARANMEGRFLSILEEVKVQSQRIEPDLTMLYFKVCRACVDWAVVVSPERNQNINASMQVLGKVDMLAVGVSGGKLESDQ